GLGVAAAALCVLALVAVAAVPGSGERLRRVGLPWFRPTVVAPYRVVVSSGNPVIRRGDPVTLSAYLNRTDPSAPIPDAAVLVLHDESGERPLPMTRDGAAALHVTPPAVPRRLQYPAERRPAGGEGRPPPGGGPRKRARRPPPAGAPAPPPPQRPPAAVPRASLNSTGSSTRRPRCACGSTARPRPRSWSGIRTTPRPAPGRSSR